MLGFEKRDNDFSTIRKIVRTEVNRNNNKLLASGTNAEFIRNYSFGGGGGSFDGSNLPPARGVAVEAYGVTGATIGEATVVSRSVLKGSGMVYIYVSSPTNAEIIAEVQLDPAFAALRY